MEEKDLEKILMLEWIELARRQEDRNPLIACEAFKKGHEEIDKYNGFINSYAWMNLEKEYTRFSQGENTLSAEFKAGLERYVNDNYVKYIKDATVSDMISLGKSRGYSVADNVMEGLNPYLGTKYTDIQKNVNSYEYPKRAMEFLKDQPGYENECNSIKERIENDSTKEEYKKNKNVLKAVDTIENYKFEKMYLDVLKGITDKTLDSIYPKAQAESEELREAA